MSNPNVALVYEILGAYQQGDEERLRSLMHPDAVFGWLYEWEDGLSRRFHVYPDLEGALEAGRRMAAERP
jgi:hypothetical protein